MGGAAGAASFCSSRTASSSTSVTADDAGEAGEALRSCSFEARAGSPEAAAARSSRFASSANPSSSSILGHGSSAVILPLSRLHMPRRKRRQSTGPGCWTNVHMNQAW